MQPSKRQKQTHDAQPNGMEPLLNGNGMVAKLMERFAERDRIKYNESRAAVKSGAVNGDVDMPDAKGEVVEISSDSSSSEEDSEDDEDEDNQTEDTEHTEERLKAQKAKQLKDEQLAEGIKKQRAYEERKRAREADDDEEDDDAAPTFAELLARENPDEAIDVEAEFEGDNAGDAPNQIALRQGAHLTASTNATTMYTVLAQALRTNDRDMLENCLAMANSDSVRLTIEKLPSPLVATLLQRLAEKIHRRPGRARLLMVWVQWSLVAHGGYLVSQVDVMKALAKLKTVINERAGALNPLLRLKGRLDMLDAQLQLRKSVQTQIQRNKAGDQEAVVYVEGEDEDSSEEEEDSEDEAPVRKSKPLSQRIQLRASGFIDDDEEQEAGDGEAAMLNGIESDGSIEEEDSEEDNDLIDDEAEETDDDDGDEEESEDAFEEGIDDGEDVSEGEDMIPLEPKPIVRGRKGGFGR